MRFGRARLGIGLCFGRGHLRDSLGQKILAGSGMRQNMFGLLGVIGLWCSVLWRAGRVRWTRCGDIGGRDGHAVVMRRWHGEAG